MDDAGWKGGEKTFEYKNVNNKKTLENLWEKDPLTTSATTSSSSFCDVEIYSKSTNAILLKT